MEYRCELAEFVAFTPSKYSDPRGRGGKMWARIPRAACVLYMYEYAEGGRGEERTMIDGSLPEED